MLELYLRGLQDTIVVATSDDATECILQALRAYYSILLLLLIRCTLRSILRYSRYGLIATGHQANQDHSLDRGLLCPLYQPMLFVLEASQLAFGDFGQDSTIPISLRKLYAEAHNVLNSRRSIGLTLLEHIALVFEQFFPSPGGNAGMGLGVVDEHSFPHRSYWDFTSTRAK